jgi:hypothetical protein
MGSYAEIWLGSLHVGTTKNDIDPALMLLFRSSDKFVLDARKQDLLPLPVRLWASGLELEEDEHPSVVFYKAPVTAIRDRLELKGYTLRTAESALTASLSFFANEYEAMVGPASAYSKPIAETLRSSDVDQWFSALKLINAQGLLPRAYSGQSGQSHGTLVDFILENSWYEYVGPDLSVALRLALEACSDADELIYDVSDLVLSEYFSADDDFVSYALEAFSTDYPSSSKTIVLTEGRTDSWIISESIKLLYPHLTEYFTFMDFDGARIAGGAGGLANMVKAFAGAGILNKVVAIFDNDTAAEAAIRSLRNIRLPANIQILKLPPTASLNDYPTVGPSGPVTMNVNGVAGSIELYLGDDVLREPDNKLAPVQWTGYDQSVAKYQGEVLFKDRLHERFRKKLQGGSDSGVLNRVDWTDIRLVLSAIFKAFHEFDANHILSRINDYHDDETGV